MFKRLVFCTAAVATAVASNFDGLDAALPTNIDAASIAPVFDFEMEGCLPAAPISRDGEQNRGLNITGPIGGECRLPKFMDMSNTYHRHACTTMNAMVYCTHFYSLYFVKDQAFPGIGHLHDWEVAVIWTREGAVTHATASRHGEGVTLAVETLPTDSDGHIQVVYEKDTIRTHIMRFAQLDEPAENPLDRYVTPPIVSWYELSDDIRGWLNAYDYMSATLPSRDGQFLDNINAFKPTEYPIFTSDDILAANPYATSTS